MHPFNRVNDLNDKNCAQLNISQLQFSGTMTVILRVHAVKIPMSRGSNLYNLFEQPQRAIIHSL